MQVFKEEMSIQNQRVLKVLMETLKPLSAYEILDKVRKFGMRSPPTIYRALDFLCEKGLVHRVESLNSFVACHHAEGHGACGPLAICSKCGAVEELEEKEIQTALRKIGAGFLKQIDKEVLEITGVCHACCAQKEGKQ